MSSINPPKKIPYVRLGNSGLKVLRLILGLASYGNKSMEEWVLGKEEGIAHIKAVYGGAGGTRGYAPQSHVHSTCPHTRRFIPSTATHPRLHRGDEGGFEGPVAYRYTSPLPTLPAFGTIVGAILN
ncbi:hypothetical protein RhiTH_007446 [Rhizoctonia solani]